MVMSDDGAPQIDVAVADTHTELKVDDDVNLKDAAMDAVARSIQPGCLNWDVKDPGFPSESSIWGPPDPQGIGEGHRRIPHLFTPPLSARFPQGVIKSSEILTKPMGNECFWGSESPDKRMKG